MSKRRCVKKMEVKEEKKVKACPKCEQTKSLSDFGRDASRLDGRYTYCKQCRRNPNRKDREVLELAEKGLKVCTKCAKVKPFHAFDKDSTKRLGHTSRCKKCHREQRKERAAEWHMNKSELAALEQNGRTRCYKCLEVKPLHFFLKNKNYVTGYCRLCLMCNNFVRKEYNLKRTKSRRDYTRWEVFEDDEFTCYICEELLSPDTPSNEPKSLSIDHVVPVSRGGLDERDNVRTACLNCNRHKNDMMLEDFLVRLTV